jgi:hypothetical protein
LLFLYWLNATPASRRFPGISDERVELRAMHVRTDFASESELLDRVMDKGIVVEVWDQLGLAAIDLSQMRITVSVLQLFARGQGSSYRPGYFFKVDRHGR